MWQLSANNNIKWKKKKKMFFFSFLFLSWSSDEAWSSPVTCGVEQLYGRILSMAFICSWGHTHAKCVCNPRKWPALSIYVVSLWHSMTLPRLFAGASKERRFDSRRVVYSGSSVVLLWSRLTDRGLENYLNCCCVGWRVMTVPVIWIKLAQVAREVPVKGFHRSLLLSPTPALIAIWWQTACSFPSQSVAVLPLKLIVKVSHIQDGAWDLWQTRRVYLSSHRDWLDVVKMETVVRVTVSNWYSRSTKPTSWSFILSDKVAACVFPLFFSSFQSWPGAYCRHSQPNVNNFIPKPNCKHTCIRLLEPAMTEERSRG